MFRDMTCIDDFSRECPKFCENSKNGANAPFFFFIKKIW